MTTEEQIFEKLGGLMAGNEAILREIQRMRETNEDHADSDDKRFASLGEQVLSIKTVQDVQLGKYAIISAISLSIGGIVSGIIVWWVTHRL